jgi:hypothetical protein
MELVLAHGDHIGDKIVLSRKDTRELIDQFRKDLQDLQSLEKKGGVTAVVDGDALITAYRKDSYVRPTRKRATR